MTPRPRALRLLATHATRYPAWCAVDVYKLLFQACMGSEHAIDDPRRVRDLLIEEWARTNPDPESQLLEDISITAPLWRLHLGAAKASGIQPGDVLALFFRCAASFQPRPELLAELWAEAVRELRAGRIVITDSDALDDLDGRIRAASYPAMSHSPTFRQAYRPAYRLVSSPPA